MGLMQGRIDIPNKTLYVMDAFALPVQGTETRVNAQNEAYEYMVEYLEGSKEVRHRGLLTQVWRSDEALLTALSLHLYRLEDWKMPSDGITPTQAMAAGCRAST